MTFVWPRNGPLIILIPYELTLIESIGYIRNWAYQFVFMLLFYFHQRLVLFSHFFLVDEKTGT